jgi:hypothetical protein
MQLGVMQLGSPSPVKLLTSRVFGRLLSGLLLSGLLLLSGCTSAFNAFTASTETPLEFRIRQVAPANRPGIYSITGETSLPDDTLVTVTAFRPLTQTNRTPGNQAAPQAAQTTPNYAILDRKVAEVRQGIWKTDLNLWQVAPNGDFREAWQLNPSILGVRFQPQPNVTFLATLEPANQPPELQPQLNRLSDSPRATLTQYTSDSELYLQANQTIAVALPTGKTTPPAAPAQLKPETKPVKVIPAADPAGELWKQTSAPLDPEAFLR